MITVPVVAWLAAVFALPLTCVVLAQTRLSLARMRVVVRPLPEPLTSHAITTRPAWRASWGC